MKKLFWLFLIVAVLGAGAIADAQQAKKIPRLGYLESSGSPNNPGPQLEAFRQGLHDLGYVEGKNILAEYRYAEGKLDRIPSLVNELVQLNVDVIATGNLTAILAAKQATKTIPIVMVSSVEPVAAGIIDSLARPGGNITGLSRFTRELSGKRLELLKEVVPRLRRVGVLWATDSPGSTVGFKEYEAVAAGLKLQLQSLEVRGATPDLEGAFKAAAKGRASALVTLTIPCFDVIQRRSRTLP